MYHLPKTEGLISSDSEYTRHCGIVAGEKTTISAGENNILRNDWGFRANQSNVVFRR